MARTALYPEGSEQLNVIVPGPVKRALKELAGERRQSVSQVVTIALEDYLHRRRLLANNSGGNAAG